MIDGNGVLVRLSDSGQTLGDPTDDVRGRTVFEDSGSRLGTVEDLLIDPVHRRIRLLRVVRGGIFGWGATPCYVPANAVVHAGAAVFVRTSGGPAPAGQGYDPDLAPETDDAGTHAGFLLYTPSWVSGYFPPTSWTRRPPR